MIYEDKEYRMHVDEFIKRQPGWFITFAASVILIAIGALDYVTGWELSVSLLYALNILLVAWYVNRFRGLVFALVSAVIWWWANKDVHPYLTYWGYSWATTSRLAYFLFVAIGGSTIKAWRVADQAHIKALERARDLEHEIAHISEHEQQKLGQDLHDGICQVLAAIQWALSSVRDDLKCKGLPEAAATDEVVKMIKDAIKQTRDLARSIFPVNMEEAGLPASLDELVLTSKRIFHIEATFEMRREVGTIHPEVAMHLYRIVQEALNNAVRHSKARTVSVSLDEENELIKLAVVDDGIGFPASKTLEAGMGLKTMSYRAQQIGAQINIKNNAICGVTIECCLSKALASQPLTSSEKND